jgi:hypothetical protein
MANNGTQKATLAFIYIKGQEFQCTAVDWTDDSKHIAHRATNSLNILDHSESDRDWSVKLEQDVKKNEKSFSFDDIKAPNACDVVIAGPNKRIRLVQGVLMPGYKETMKVGDKWVRSFDVGDFKDKREE